MTDSKLSEGTVAEQMSQNLYTNAYNNNMSNNLQTGNNVINNNNNNNHMHSMSMNNMSQVSPNTRGLPSLVEIQSGSLGSQTQLLQSAQYGAGMVPNQSQMNMSTPDGYYKERQENGPWRQIKYDEVMQPWENNENEFHFKCWTEYNVKTEIQSQSIRNLEQQQNKGSLSLSTGTSVYHRKKSDRLIIKKREKASIFALTRQNPNGWVAFAIIVVGILIILYGFVDFSLTAIIAGFIIMISGISVPCCCNKSKTNALSEFVYTTQSIPINSIHFVDRQLETYDANAVQNQCCSCCCGTNAQISIKFSQVTIGFNRSNISKAFGITGLATNSEDTVTVRLRCIDAYNLQQYLNGILDGKNRSEINYNDILKPNYYSTLPMK